MLRAYKKTDLPSRSNRQKKKQRRRKSAGTLRSNLTTNEPAIQKRRRRRKSRNKTTVKGLRAPPHANTRRRGGKRTELGAYMAGRKNKRVRLNEKQRRGEISDPTIQVQHRLPSLVNWLNSKKKKKNQGYWIGKERVGARRNNRAGRG